MGGVVVHVDEGKAIRRLAELTDVAPTKIRDIIAAPLIVDFEEGRVTPEAFCEQLNRALGAGIPFATFAQLWNDMFTEFSVTTTLIERLAGRYPLGCLSNTNALHAQQLIAQVPAMRHFQWRVFSHEVGARKPKPAIYAHALKLAGVTAADVVYLDDRAELVQAARALGWRVIHVTEPEIIPGALQAEGITISERGPGWPEQAARPG